MNSAVLLAAGNSSRMGGELRKPFLELAGRWVLDHACEAFDRASSIDEIVLVCQPEDVDRIERARSKLPSFRKVSSVVTGGARRTDSVRAGVKRVSPRAEIIAIHDSARPLVLPADIDRTVQAAVLNGAALLAIPVTDTIKTSSDGRYSESTLERSVLWRAQTPQAFRASLLLLHLQRAEEEDFCPTDDIALHERYSQRAAIVEGSEDNLKLTSPRDFIVAEAILGAREKAV